MPTITTVYTGEMAFTAEAGGHRLTIDVPAGMGGRDRGPTPPELFVVSLGSCIAAYVATYCEQHGMDTTGLAVDVSYTKVDDPTRLADLAVTVRLPQADCGARAAAIRRVAQHCPVHETMSIRVLIGYDGSPAASAAIDAGTQLFPRAHAWVAHLWTPPFASGPLRNRLWTGTRHVDEFVAAVEREGEREADRMAATGVTLARAAGWDAEPLVVRGYSGEGVQLAALAEKMDADLVLVGSRGRSAVEEIVLGSVAMATLHHAYRPVLVAPPAGRKPAAEQPF